MSIEYALNVVLVYVIWGNSDAARFCTYYRQYPADYPHTLIVIGNNHEWKQFRHHFEGIQCVFIEGDNIGQDIGAFQCAADQIDCDLMVFFGASAYVTGKGWLNRMVDAYEKHGFGIYGSTGSGAELRYQVFTHIRTTGFWMPPELLRSYPYDTDSSRNSRYGFEHGSHNITNWVLTQGGRALMVTWIGEYEYPEWATAPNAFRNGNQTAVIVRDKLCDPPYYP